MKIHYVTGIICTALGMCASCSTSEDEPATLTLSRYADVLFSAEAPTSDAKVIEVSTNQPTWNAVSDQSWCVITKEKDRFSITAQPNTSLTAPTRATITVTAGVAAPVVLHAAQAASGPLLKIYSTDTVCVKASPSMTDKTTLEFFTNLPEWEITSDQPWCTIEKGTTSFRFLCTNNQISYTHPRYAKITISAHKGMAIFVQQAAITVKQEPNDPSSFIALKRVAAGSFTMGLDPAKLTLPWVNGQFKATLTQDFLLSIHEVTNAQYAFFLNTMGVGKDGKGVTALNTSTSFVRSSEYIMTFDGTSFVEQKNTTSDWGLIWDQENKKWIPAPGCDDYPATRVYWEGALAFCQWLGGTIPTTAQSEYACRAGSSSLYYWGDDQTLFDQYEWSDGASHPVGKKQANAWGFYDMIGNAVEWCYDNFTDYSATPKTDPIGNITTIQKSVRNLPPYASATQFTSAFTTLNTDYTLGFRVLIPVSN